MDARLTEEDIASLEAAKKGSPKYEAARTTVERRLSNQMVASLKIAGLEDWETGVCQEWAGLSTAAGVSEECRYAKFVLNKVPLPPKPDILSPGILDKRQFWDQMGLAEHLAFFWDARHFQDHSPEPRTVLGQIALKLILYWRGFAEENWPTPVDMYWALRRKETKDTKRRRLEHAETKVGLAAIWRVALHLERAWHGRGHRSSINPEDIYEALGDLQDQVEENCWARDDQTMLELLKKTGGYANGCSFCDMYSLDSFEFGWSSGFGPNGVSITTCPRCSGRLMERLENTSEPPQAYKWDGGPTPPERGDYAYRWAIKHGYMWDEFLQQVRGLQTGFNTAKKTLCPLLDQCNTRCAQDQKNSVRGWPLGSSNYETSCYKFREIIWCQQTGGTPEQFQTVEHARHEGRLKAQKNNARRERQPKKAAISLAQEQTLFPEHQRPEPPPPAPQQAASPVSRTRRRAAQTTPAQPPTEVQAPRMF